MKKIHGFSLEQVFQQAHLEKLGATFDEFQANPLRTLERYGQGDAILIMQHGLRPLLPSQVLLRNEMEAKWRADGSWHDSMRREVAPRSEAGMLGRLWRAIRGQMLGLKHVLQEFHRRREEVALARPVSRFQFLRGYRESQRRTVGAG